MGIIVSSTIDVSSLYTNIPHDEGAQYAKEAYQQTFKRHTHMPHPNTIHKLTNIVLKNNVIRFADNCYLQTQGTAMGTKMAPSYANLFMGKIEQQLQSMSTNILFWKRFIDDIFLIWKGTQQELSNFTQDINQIHPTIKFT